MQRRTVLSDGPQGPETAASDVKVERSNDDECSRGKTQSAADLQVGRVTKNPLKNVKKNK